LQPKQAWTRINNLRARPYSERPRIYIDQIKPQCQPRITSESEHGRSAHGELLSFFLEGRPIFLLQDEARHLRTQISYVNGSQHRLKQDDTKPKTQAMFEREERKRIKYSGQKKGQRGTCRIIYPPELIQAGREQEAVLPRHQWQYHNLSEMHAGKGAIASAVPTAHSQLFLDKFLRLRRTCSDGMGNYYRKLDDDKSGNNDRALPTRGYIISQFPKPYFTPTPSALQKFELLSLVHCPALGIPRCAVGPATFLCLLFLHKAFIALPCPLSAFSLARSNPKPELMSNYLTSNF
jgi:hypothetical protein